MMACAAAPIDVDQARHDARAELLLSSNAAK
jgi:hypothetical protein